LITKDLKYYLSEKKDKLKNDINARCSRSGHDSWLFIPKISESKVCLVSHLDTVHREDWNHKTLVHDREQGIFWSPEGLGADDRAGVWAVLHLFESLNSKLQPYVLITDKEEVGGVGAKEAIRAFEDILRSDDITYFIEIDRRGSRDAVFYCNEPQEFRKYVKRFGFVEVQGTFSDISIIGSYTNKCAVNLSTGYYHEHSPKEMLRVQDIENTISKVKRMLADNARKKRVWLNDTAKRHFSIWEDLLGHQQDLFMARR